MIKRESISVHKYDESYTLWKKLMVTKEKKKNGQFSINPKDVYDKLKLHYYSDHSNLPQF